MTHRVFKKRILRFSLLSLLFCILVVCAGFGWKVVRARAQQETVAWIEKTGGHVIYSHMLGEHGQILHSPRAPGPQWLREILGGDFFDNVIVAYVNGRDKVNHITLLARLSKLEILDLSNTHVSDLEPLTNMIEIESLHLYGSSVVDIGPLAGLTNLSTLLLNDTDVSNVSPLVGLTKLRVLSLHGTSVSEEDYRLLQKALPDCKISWGNPHD